MLWVEPEPRDTLDDFMAKIAIPLTDHLSHSEFAENAKRLLGNIHQTMIILQ